MHRTAVAACCLLLNLPAGSLADPILEDRPYPTVRTGRYTALVALPTAAQADPLQELVTVTFPPETVTVEQALKHLLIGTGYRLVSGDTEGVHPNLPWLLDQPLPRVHRALGPLTLADALGVLGGPAFRPVVDHLHRFITFETTPVYRALAGRAGIEGNGQ